MRIANDSTIFFRCWFFVCFIWVCIFCCSFFSIQLKIFPFRFKTKNVFFSCAWTIDFGNDVSHWTDRTLLILFDHKQVTFTLESLSFSSSSSASSSSLMMKKKNTGKKTHVWRFQVDWSSLRICNSHFERSTDKQENDSALEFFFCFVSFAASAVFLYLCNMKTMRRSLSTVNQLNAVTRAYVYVCDAVESKGIVFVGVCICVCVRSYMCASVCSGVDRSRSLLTELNRSLSLSLSLFLPNYVHFFSTTKNSFVWNTFELFVVSFHLRHVKTERIQLRSRCEKKTTEKRGGLFSVRAVFILCHSAGSLLWELTRVFSDLRAYFYMKYIFGVCRPANMRFFLNSAPQNVHRY